VIPLYFSDGSNGEQTYETYERCTNLTFKPYLKNIKETQRMNNVESTTLTLYWEQFFTLKGYDFLLDFENIYEDCASMCSKVPLFYLNKTVDLG